MSIVRPFYPFDPLVCHSLPLIHITAQTNKFTAPKAVVRSAVVASKDEKIPDHLVYRYFLGHINHLDKQADDLARQGKNPDELRNYYKKKLSLSETEDATLKQIARDIETQLGIQDGKAKQFIANERKKFPNGKLPSRDALPKVPQELVKMQQDRDALIKSKISQCKGSLSEAANGKIDRFLGEEFVRTIKVQDVGIPRSHNPKNRRPAAFLNN